MSSWEAGVWEWKTAGLACSFYSSMLFGIGKNHFSFYFFFKDDVVLSMFIWKTAMVLHGPFMSLQSGEIANTSVL